MTTGSKPGKSKAGWTQRVELRSVTEARSRLRLAVTPSCNLACFFCHGDGGSVTPVVQDSPLAIADILRAIEIANDCGVQKVKLTGGEPTLYHHDRRSVIHLVEAIGNLSDRLNLDFSMVSNGIALSKELCRSLREAGLQRMSISLHAASEANFQRYSGRPGTLLHSVIDGIANSVDAGINPTKINSVVYHSKSKELSNIAQIKNIIEIGKRTNVSEIRFFVVIPHNRMSSALYDDVYVSWEDPILDAFLPSELLDCIRRSDDDGSIAAQVTQGSYRLAFKSLDDLILPELSFQRHLHHYGTRECDCVEGSYAVRMLSDGGLRACLSDPADRNIIKPIRAGDKQWARKLFTQCQDSLHGSSESILFSSTR